MLRHDPLRPFYPILSRSLARFWPAELATRFPLDLLAHLPVSLRIEALTALLSSGQSFVVTVKCSRYKSALNAI